MIRDTLFEIPAKAKPLHLPPTVLEEILEGTRCQFRYPAGDPQGGQKLLTSPY